MESFTFVGRIRKPIGKKLNPVWWFQNDDEQTVDQAPWFHPEWPEWRRKLCWNIRNPLQNFRAFVIGVQDRDYTVTGKAPVQTIQRDDIGETGFQWCVIRLSVPLPFVSYSGTRFVWQLGWQPNGFFSIKFNF